ncbi:hypothetical protein Leryth_009864 [Lithospermum erythrorhizon]|nr:hypothetical protein Leryth_009864 [Lithospermum erythrorhizon]
MSGGVGPCSEICLPKEEQQVQPDGVDFSKKQQKQEKGRSFFTFKQMNALAVVIVLSTSGMVSIEDAAFVVFSLMYMYFISRVAFPPISSNFSVSEPHVFNENNRILSVYTFLGIVIGLFLPIAYIFEGIFEGDKEGIKAATPHVFLLASQIFMEGVACGGSFSLPIQVFVPVFYNSRRIFTLVEWLRNEIYKVEKENSGGGRRLYVGRLLAIANASFWCFNLFGFLLPIYLPRAFKNHYSAAAGYKTAKQM